VKSSEVAVSNQKEFDDLYIAFLAKKASLPPTDFRGLLLYLAKTCDSGRYNTLPDNLGRPGRPPANASNRRVFRRSKMAEWKPLAAAISQKKFDDLYIALLGKEPELPETDFRGLLLHLAKTRDSRRYGRTKPENLGRRGRRPLEVSPAAEAHHAALIAVGEKPSRADFIAAQGDKNLAEVLRKRRTRKS
jgi:hypothetical protein